MKKRIQIDGVWYVPEKKEKQTIELIPIDSMHCTVENKRFCFEAVRIYNERQESYYPHIDIEVTDKRKDGEGKKDYWDNHDWFLNVLEEDSDALKEIPDDWSDDDKEYFIAFLQHLKDKEWL